MQQKKEFAKKKEATVLLQSKMREKSAKSEFAKNKKSCTLLQSRARTWKAKKDYYNDQNAVKLAQSMCRRNICQREYKTVKEKTIHVQRLVKRFVRNIQLQSRILALHQAAKKGKLTVVVELLDKDRDLRNVRNRYDHGKTLLHSASMSNSVELIALLCSDKKEVFALDR